MNGLYCKDLQMGYCEILVIEQSLGGTEEDYERYQ
jgi:hypothetical protein